MFWWGPGTFERYLRTLPRHRHKVLEFTAGVFHDIFNDPYAFLTHLSVEDRGQSLVLDWMMYVKRMEKDNALKQVDGGYSYLCRQWGGCDQIISSLHVFKESMYANGRRKNEITK